MSKKPESVHHALTAALGTALDALEEETSTYSSEAVADSVVDNKEVENSRRDRSVAAGMQANVSKDIEMEESESTDYSVRCIESRSESRASYGDNARVCVNCKLAVYAECYTDALSQPKEKRSSTASKQATRLCWTCDPCRCGVDPRVVRCVYCGTPGGEQALKLVEKDGNDGFWKQYKQFEAQSVANTNKFGHVLCINWDPRRLAAHMLKESLVKSVKKPVKKEPAKEIATESEIDTSVAVAHVDSGEREDAIVDEIKEPLPDMKELLMRDFVSSSECCFCHSRAGVRIQCRRVNCGQFFHAMCAQKGKGHVELRTGLLVQFHAYCDRHRSCTEDIGDLLAKLVTRPIRLLVGRDDMRRFGTIAKHLPDYKSAMIVMRDLASLIVGYCHKSLRTSKSNPPDYNVKHLQVLQFFLSHVPQLEKVYGLPPTPLQDLVNDKKLFRRLERMFNPPRYLAKYPGPLSQQHTCDVCLDPFHERQHLFYCSGNDMPHVQHWRCTKRQTTVRERERSVSGTGNVGAKKKRNAILVVQNGMQKDIALPKGLPSMTDDIICGVCCAPIDTRGLIASRKEAKHLDFEKRESNFAQSGCYINVGGAKGQCGFAYSAGSTTSSRKPPRSTDGKSNSGYSTAQQTLTPPKMERINVQRTTKWLALVAQIIRQARIPASAAATTSVNAQVADTIVSSGSENDAVDMAAVPLAVDDAKDAGAKFVPTALDSTAPGDSATADAAQTLPPVKLESQCAIKAVSEAEEAQAPASTLAPSTRSSTMKDTSLVTPAMQTLFDEAMRLVQPYDAYALSKLETAHDFLVHRSGPGVAVLRMLTHEYTRFVYIKHTRAVEKARNEKRLRAKYEAREHRERERKRMNLEAERALKKQMLAMRNRQRQQLKVPSSE